MHDINRREILKLISITPLFSLLDGRISAEEIKGDSRKVFSETVTVLKSAYLSEMTAYAHYIEYAKKALEEKYRNIAYLFTAFSVSEKIHAENYKLILSGLNIALSEPVIKSVVKTTKKNLKSASINELSKINDIYPNYLRKLGKESNDEAIVNCMWAWKSHRQHEDTIKEVYKYSGWFFSSVAKRIESAEYDFYVCKICGSTIDEKPDLPCEICNYPEENYMNIQKPVLRS